MNPSCVQIVALLLAAHAVVLGTGTGQMGKGHAAGLGMSWLLPLESSLISDASRVPDNPQQPLPDDELQAHGTTTLAFVSGEGVFLAVDSRASIGKYVGSRTTRKVFPMSRHVVATMAGGAADCTYWIRLCTRIAKLHEYNAGSPLSVASLAAMLAKRLREMRGSKLSVGTMVAGWDTENGRGASLYYVDSEGTCIPGKTFCVGSGANLAYSILDSEILSDLSVEKAVDLATWAIRHATNRDGFSGGWINVFHINATGITHMKRLDSRNISIHAA